ncbi:hypothetical protein ACO0LL_22625 [Undibacterium sp. TC4M20W]|uniref:hypothetical protein n=1 Tax=unclassified Undibacterium TaxID=2630295 RepID=UPI001331D366|nr:hypothetical protein [Undibacterium sp. YM2]BBB67786.1 hypothetical protein UNDYM_3533 [Undibacterium sp. YM2]
MRNLNNFVRAFFILLCLIPMVGFGACGAFGIFFAVISFSLIPLAYGVAGLLICALLYKLIGKIASK